MKNNALYNFWRRILCLAGLSSPRRDLRRMWQAHLGSVCTSSSFSGAGAFLLVLQQLCSFCFLLQHYPHAPGAGAVTSGYWAEIVGKAHPSAGWIWRFLFHCTLVFPDHGQGERKGVPIGRERNSSHNILMLESPCDEMCGGQTHFLISLYSQISCIETPKLVRPAKRWLWAVAERPSPIVLFRESLKAFCMCSKLWMGLLWNTANEHCWV